jgi:hypothetical protein
MARFTGFRKSAVSIVKNWFTPPLGDGAREPEVLRRRRPMAPAGTTMAAEYREPPA